MPLLYMSACRLAYSPVLYTTFWTLQAYDLYIPKDAYEREVLQVKAKISQIELESGREVVS